MERLSGHAECRCGSILDLTGFYRQHFPTANPVVRTEPEPRCKRRCAAKAREIRTDFRQQSLRGEDVDPWNSRQVYSEDSMEMTAADRNVARSVLRLSLVFRLRWRPSRRSTLDSNASRYCSIS